MLQHTAFVCAGATMVCAFDPPGLSDEPRRRRQQAARGLDAELLERYSEESYRAAQAAGCLCVSGACSADQTLAHVVRLLQVPRVVGEGWWWRVGNAEG